MATAQDVLKICAKEVGVKESPANSNNVKYNTWFYGHKVSGSDYSWCAVYLDWCFEKAGAGKLFPHNANAAYSQDEIVSKCGGKWIMKKNKSSATRKAALSKYKPGDIVTFDFGAYDAWRDHIGIIRSVNIAAGTVQCYEGNTSKNGSQSNGGMVCLKTRRYSDICACVRPAYSGSSTTKTEPVNKSAEVSMPEVSITEKITKRRAVDVSAWQGKISYNSWLKVKKAGYDTCILRTSYTSQSSFSLAKDKVFENNIKNAIAAGMKIGVYHYSQAVNVAEAEKEANYTLKIINPYKRYINEPVVFDDEFGERWSASKAKKLGKSGTNKRCKKFCDIVKKAGYEPMVYANRNMFDTYLDAAELKKLYKVWLAQYSTSTSFTDMYMWQHSSSGKVSGLSGNIDVNKIYDTTVKKIILHTPNGKLYTGKFPTAMIYKNHGTKANIKAWQKFLNFTFGKMVCDPDGDFGNITREYTLKFQNAFGLEQDGVVGDETIKMAKRVKK